jgi:hypothetical protein
MKRMKNVLLEVILVTALWPAAIPMGESESTEKEPLCVDLEEDQESYDGSVIDEGTTTPLTKISFYGDTKVGGVLREDNDSVSELDFSHIKSLKVSQASYTSKRYPLKDVVAVTVTDFNGNNTEYLFPKRIVLCGIVSKDSKDSEGAKKSWYLYQIDELIIKGKTPPAAPNIDDKSKKTMPAALNKKVSPVTVAHKTVSKVAAQRTKV